MNKDTIEVCDKKLKNLTSINVILGKNGCGKSTMLRTLDSNREQWEKVIYITPERGGQMVYEPIVYHNMNLNPSWADNSRRRNYDEQFRQKSITQLKEFEEQMNRKIANDDYIRKETNQRFQDTLGSINELLDNVKIKISDSDKPTLEFINKDSKEIIKDEQLSSGEKELAGLAIEILYFVYQVKNGNKDKPSLLLLDEPDVHIHPDLQYRLINLLVDAVKDKPITTIIATHSTAILSALSHRNSDAHVGFMRKGQNEISFISIDETLQDVMPIFGAHPLSNVFNQNPIMLVEGEDDQRIWQQAVRSSKGKIRLWPCEAGDKSKLEVYEETVSKLIDSVYENAKAYSLRDRDNDPYEINNKKNVLRFRLNCYAAENLILSNDVLESIGINWNEMKNRIKKWLNDESNKPENERNKYYENMRKFADDKKFDRQNAKIKDLENIFTGLAQDNKPWEVRVGQAIAKLSSKSSNEDGSLVSFLGQKLVDTLKLCN